MNSLAETVKDLPDTPGVYIFRNSSKKVIYVGKAINLKNRVSSYFHNSGILMAKTKAMVSKITSLEIIRVDNEIEALILEAELIKRYHPPYNISMKDDKFYKFITIITDSTGAKRIGTSRKKGQKKTVYIGPYPESSSISIILKTLRKIFPYRDCAVTKFNRYKNIKRPCLYGHIGICPTPCVNTAQIETNNKNVDNIKDYLTGNRKMLFRSIKKEMEKASKEERFEDAAILRDQIQSYDYITQTTRNVKEYLEEPNIVMDSQITALEKLIEELEKNGISFDPYKIKEFRIETYDISNIQGKNAVGSMIVFTGGAPDKKEYRKFKIKMLDTPDDFSMMKEVLSRRFDKKVGWKMPDLIIIDGGKGQLSSANEILLEQNIKIPAIGLAKREEEIIIQTDNRFFSILLEKRNEGLKLLQRARDEAHRFAISFYRKKHLENLIKPIRG